MQMSENNERLIGDNVFMESSEASKQHQAAADSSISFGFRRFELESSKFINGIVCVKIPSDLLYPTDIYVFD